MLDPSALELVAAAPLFQGLPGEGLELLGRSGVRRRYGPGEPLFWAGEPVERLYLLEKGRARVYKDSPGGRRLTLFQYGPGELFCFASLFASRAEVSCEVVEEAVVISLEKGAVARVLDLFPSVGVRAIRCMSAKMADYSMMVDEMAFHDLTARLACRLLSALEPGGEGVELGLDELAGRLGTCREVVCRALKRLKEQGLVERRGRMVVIVDERGLRGLINSGRE